MDKIAGPFQKDFNEKLHNLNLRRQIYHKGALIRNDVHKLTLPENIATISSVFKAKEIRLEDDTTKVFSSDEMVDKVEKVLNKFAKCYQVYMLSRPLCQREVSQLEENCKDFGSWAKENIRRIITERKFHILVNHVPQRAKLIHSVGMEIEEASESIHPVINRLERTYCSIQNIKERFGLIMKAQWNQSDSCLPYFKTAKTRICPKCNNPSHHGRKCDQVWTNF